MIMILRRIGRSRHPASRDTCTSLYIVGLGNEKQGHLDRSPASAVDCPQVRQAPGFNPLTQPVLTIHALPHGTLNILRQPPPMDEADNRLSEYCLYFCLQQPA